ncbi:hypothetical protein JOQ06_021632 [Pogonophryne albipinna]|uniref:Uncharacterized protein n=1 Tax=Pogonophryne albipinna TaxID=1090488 RepID=A0AAD6F6D9_9TELE|nr:hypothetical protein JOQ06_021632 [Pogonophryne albipinna]
MEDRRQQESTWRTEDSQSPHNPAGQKTARDNMEDRRQQESTWRTEDSKSQHGGQKTARVNMEDRRQQESTWRTDGTGGQSECKSTSSTLSTGAPPKPRAPLPVGRSRNTEGLGF